MNTISKQVAADRSLMYKKILLITIIVTAFLLAGCQKRERELDIFMELVIFLSGGCGHNSRTLYFIVENDGTLISYNGISHSGCHLTEGYFSSSNLMRSIREREEIKLSAQDFQHISDLTNEVVEKYDGGGAFAITHWHITLLYEGTIYGNSTMFVKELMNLVHRILELTPVTIRGG